MFNKLIKILVVFVIFYQTPVYSKSASFNEFNSRDLSNYFSGIIAFENKDNSDALKFFNTSKILFIKNISTFVKSKTLVAVTHRKPILNLVDRILVVENGKVIIINTVNQKADNVYIEKITLNGENLNNYLLD